MAFWAPLCLCLRLEFRFSFLTRSRGVTVWSCPCVFTVRSHFQIRFRFCWLHSVSVHNVRSVLLSFSVQSICKHYASILVLLLLYAQNSIYITPKYHYYSPTKSILCFFFFWNEIFSKKERKLNYIFWGRLLRFWFNPYRSTHFHC